MGEAVSAGGLDSFLNLTPTKNTTFEINNGSQAFEVKGLFSNSELTVEQREQLKALFPEGFLEDLEKQLLGGKMLPSPPADVALGNAGEPENRAAFPELFMMLSQYLQQGPKAEPATTMSEAGALGSATVGAPLSSGGMQEWIVKLKMMLKSDSTIIGNHQITADFPEDVGSMPGFLLQKTVASASVLASASAPTPVPTSVLASASALESASAPAPGLTEVLQQQFATLLGKSPLPSLDAGTFPAQTSIPSISSLASSLSGDGGVGLNKGLADLVPPPLTSKTTDKGWDTMLGNRVMWMVGKQLQSASIKITPANMGPIEVKVAVQNDQATVSFAAQQGSVREALEMAIPRLREMFNEGNMQLVNVDVNQKDAGDQHSLEAFYKQAREGFGSADEDGSEHNDGDASKIQDGPIVVTTHDGFLDDYA